MNLQDLAYFAAVARYQHFGRAAQACHIGQPTLSAQLRKLEIELGGSLFERTNRRVSITPLGELLLPHARRALEEVRLLQTAAQSARDQLAGPIKLGAIPTIAPYLLPRILPALNKSAPRLTIDLWEDLTAQLLDRLRTGQLDAALLATPVPDSGLTALRLFDDPFLAALPARHPLAQSSVVRQQNLFPHLLLLADGHCLSAQVRSACTHRGQAPARNDFRASSLETLVNLVAAGYGATLVPHLAANSLKSRTIALRPLQKSASRTIYLASRPTFPRPKALQAIAQAVLNSVRPYSTP